MREMNGIFFNFANHVLIYLKGKYVGNRPIKLRKSTWKERNIEIVKKKEREKHRMGLK